MTMDERKQQMREIMAEELRGPGWTWAADLIEANSRREDGSLLSSTILRALDRIAALPPKPLEGRKERVEEVKKIILASVWFTSCSWVYTGEAKVFAEQIVATEPRAMSRDEMVAVVVKKDYYCEDYLNGIDIAIDAFAGKIPASGKQPNAAEAICIRFPLQGDNVIEISLQSKVSHEDFERIKQLVDLSEPALTDTESLTCRSRSAKK